MQHAGRRASSAQTDAPHHARPQAGEIVASASQGDLQCSIQQMADMVERLRVGDVGTQAGGHAGLQTGASPAPAPHSADRAPTACAARRPQQTPAQAVAAPVRTSSPQAAAVGMVGAVALSNPLNMLLRFGNTLRSTHAAHTSGARTASSGMRPAALAPEAPATPAETKYGTAAQHHAHAVAEGCTVPSPEAPPASVSLSVAASESMPLPAQASSVTASSPSSLWAGVAACAYSACSDKRTFNALLEHHATRLRSPGPHMVLHHVGVRPSAVAVAEGAHDDVVPAAAAHVSLGTQATPVGRTGQQPTQQASTATRSSALACVHPAHGQPAGAQLSNAPRIPSWRRDIDQVAAHVNALQSKSHEKAARATREAQAIHAMEDTSWQREISDMAAMVESLRASGDAPSPPLPPPPEQPSSCSPYDTKARSAAAAAAHKYDHLLAPCGMSSWRQGIDQVAARVNALQSTSECKPASGAC
ncbi:hypothetical protein FOA52_000368 [Chlamydomonas sp. UWO 241]|nr:hypothetical protein FOA52_000368 [Chlamydomonas sp. UWO 241]